MIKKLDWYILKKFLGTFFYAIMILAVIACVIDYSEKVEDFVKRQVPTWEILNYFKNFIPHITALLFPLFIFIATIFFTSKMAYKSEIIAILASGTSFQRMMRPYIIGGVFLSLVSLVANHYIVPAANKQRIAFEDKYIHYSPQSSDKNVHLRLGKDLYVYMQNYDYVSNNGFRFTAETIDGTEMKEKVMADRVTYDSTTKTWKLFNVRVRTNDSLTEKFETFTELEKEYPFTPYDLDEDEAIKDALTTPELNEYIAREKLRGRETLSFFYVEKYRRTAQPFAALILTIIGACIASRRVRGGSGLHLALGIIISATYIMALQLTNTYATKAGLDPLIATWIPNIIYGLLALYLFIRQIR
ncbi:MAG: LptF/LptG family permease [Chitinophagales bacterium]|nr:LptF/LptG family permease [Chitinophagaceae bacterium]MCB9066051.1 LptF/LptG family permease [Chitinophagales bacterium]